MCRVRRDHGNKNEDTGGGGRGGWRKSAGFEGVEKSGLSGVGRGDVYGGDRRGGEALGDERACYGGWGNCESCKLHHTAHGAKTSLICMPERHHLR